MNIENTHLFKIAVLGANGGIGSQVVKMALQQGHSVTAIVRNPDSMKIKHEHLTIVNGDVLHPETFRDHITDKDVVVCAIGDSSLKKTTLYSQGAENLLKIMKEVGSTRCYFISASGLDVNPSLNVLIRLATKFILQKILKNMYADLRKMEAIIRQSDLHWTIMRPPRLVDSAFTGKYRFSVNAYLAKGMSIARADVAHFMLDNISNASIYKSTVEVAY
jgi:putative NADH-flavin reductase